MHALVTGAAGFIGSRLAERLIDGGHNIRGVDCLTPYYSPTVKQENVAALVDSLRFDFREVDLTNADMDELLDGIDVVFHQAGQPGVRKSWAQEFSTYLDHNVLVTQRLLEAARRLGVWRFVYASSSSVYGNALSYPTRESDLPRPFSPYGVTKLAGEHLCRLYAENWGLETVSLRYFTVYGARQRPDMAIHRMIECALRKEPFHVFGSGDQVRDFTHVIDVVEANLAAAVAPVDPGAILNIAGGSSIALRDLIDLVGTIAGAPVPVLRKPAQPGDVGRTGGSIDQAASVLGWTPQMDLAAGLREQVEWHRKRGSSKT